YSHRALVCRSSKRCVCAQRLSHISLAWLCWFPADLILLGTTCFELLIGDLQVDGSIWDVDFDHIAGSNQTNRAALCRLRRDMTDRKPRCTAGEPTVCQQGAGFAKAA